MADYEKAVEVARDVIQQLQTNKNMIPQTGVFIGSYQFKHLVHCGDLQDYVDDIRADYCLVCAIGAAVLSKAKLYNNVPAEDIKMCRFYDVLADVFDMETVVLMECAFECHRTLKSCRSQVTVNEVIKSIDFGKRFELSKDRLEAIMRNIIDNDGRFVP